jgi:chromate transporter
LAIFLPSFLLVNGILPFWEGLRKNRRVREALVGVNAAVVGLLLAAFYDPVWTSGILSVGDFILAAAAFGSLAFWKLPPWLVVAATGLGGAIISFLVG